MKVDSPLSHLLCVKSSHSRFSHIFHTNVGRKWTRIETWNIVKTLLKVYFNLWKTFFDILLLFRCLFVVKFTDFWKLSKEKSFQKTCASILKISFFFSKFHRLLYPIRDSETENESKKIKYSSIFGSRCRWFSVDWNNKYYWLKCISSCNHVA